MLVFDQLLFDLLLSNQILLEQLRQTLIIIALLGSGLIAGVFFAFSTFVMNALTRLSPREGITAMQSINITVLNRWFLGVFLGTAIVCFLLLVWSLLFWNREGSEYSLAGSMFYLIGCLMVTGVFNVPRNEILAQIVASAVESESFWRKYVSEWTSWNHVRTIASLLAMTCFAIEF